MRIAIDVADPPFCDSKAFGFKAKSNLVWLTAT